MSYHEMNEKNCKCDCQKNNYVSIDLLYHTRTTIETWQKGCEILIDELQKKINKLEKHFHGDHRLVMSKLQPHKCPICEGQGGTIIGGVIDEECFACNGKCIVWG